MAKKKNPIKTIFTHGRFLAWIITTIAGVAILTTATCISFSPLLSGVFDMVFGPDRAVTKDGAATIDTYKLSDGVTDKQTAMEHSNLVNQKICEEGMVLLKNKNHALPIKTDTSKKVTVFGKNSVNMAIAGSGSAGNAASGTVSDIYDSLTEAGYEVNPVLKDFYKSDSTERSANPGMDSGGASTLEIGETPVSSYSSQVKDSFNNYKDVAVIFLTRIGGEGFDLPRQQPGNADKTFLDLYQSEKDMINLAESQGFGKIVVVINAANQLNCTELEQDDKIDSIIWAGFPGAKGIMALGEIMNGTVNPSGHLVDTYVKDFKYIPSYYNFGDNGVKGGDQFIYQGKAKQYYFVDYEEDIYVGYKYFETGAEVQGEDWYNTRVLYPFGYGLSYTTFQWTIDSSSLQGKNITKDKFNVDVTVENIGEVAGKDVVELYMKTPYSEGGIEKASKVLVGFAKTKELNPGEKEKLSIEVDPYYFASYDADDKNNNGFKGYELDSGNYTLYVSKNSHDSSNSISMSVTENIKFENDPVTNYKVENRFESVDEHLQKDDILTREKTKWKDDLSTLTPKEEDRTIDDTIYNKLKDVNWIDPANPILNDDSIQSPTFGKEGDMKLIQLVGKEFDDTSWNDLLDQVNLDEAITMFKDGGFHTMGMFSITKPKTTDCDGPVGLTNFMGDPTVYDTVTFCCEVITASTWNVDMAEELGKAVGDEGIIGNVKGDGLPYTGWYAPGMNLHRNPFGGRCCEYFSEDPFLAGKMGASEVKGANFKGMNTYMKHFVGNEGETHRDTNGCASYISEQALRELYLRPFEIAVKEGKAKGVMTSFNRLGSYWTGANYSLCTEVLRNEWGFHGGVITDFNTHHNKGGYMQLKPMLYAGGNLDLCSQPIDTSLFLDTSNPKDLTQLRKSTHEVLYAVANSNAMANEIDHYEMAYWKIAVISIDCGVFAILAGWGVWALLTTFKKAKKEE